MSTNLFSQAIVFITAEGRKLYSQATRGCLDKDTYNYSVGSKANDFKTLLKEATRDFRFVSCVNRIPTDFEANDISQSHRNLFIDYADLTLEDVLKSASITWGGGFDPDVSFNHIIDETQNDPSILQLELFLVMLSKHIKESLTIPAKKKLVLQKRRY